MGGPVEAPLSSLEAHLTGLLLSPLKLHDPSRRDGPCIEIIMGYGIYGSSVTFDPVLKAVAKFHEGQWHL